MDVERRSEVLKKSHWMKAIGKPIGNEAPRAIGMGVPTAGAPLGGRPGLESRITNATLSVGRYPIPGFSGRIPPEYGEYE